MRIYIDCEFNGHQGELISMAMVTEDGQEWYQVRPLPKVINEWVAGNVIPFLNKSPYHCDAFVESLMTFIKAHDSCEFIADHPADFKHLCEQMDAISSRNSFVIPIECTMRLIKGSPDIKSEVPHNALSDARALRDWHQGTLAPQKQQVYGDARHFFPDGI